MFGFGKKKKPEGFDQVPEFGTAKCMKCGDIHASKSKHICGGKFNNVEVIEDPKPRSMLKA